MFYKKDHIRYTVYAALVGVLSLGILAGCGDLLNKPPRGERTEATFFQNEQDAIQATNATYEQLVNYDRNDGFWSSVHYIWWLGMTDIASDDSNKGTEPTDGPDVGRIDQVTYNPSEGVFGGIWDWYYQVIYRANSAIQNLPDVDMDETLKQRLIGENKFIRAYSYFFLVRAWGGVPLVTRPLEPGEYNQPRASVEEVYNLIEEDLQDAAQFLPLKSEYAASDVGRATSGAAKGLLAKAHLFQEEYGDAQQVAEEVINSGEYSLLPGYENIFTPSGENSSESLFEIQAEAFEDGSGGITISNVQGVRGQPNLGWGFNSPERDLLNDYEPGDTRMQSTVLFVHETLPRGPEDVVRDNPAMIDERYNQKTFIPLDNPGGNLNGGNNLRRLRYSDVLLVAAEAAYHNNEPSTAQQYVNMVRERARDGRTATIGIVPEGVSSLVADTVGMSSLGNQPFIRFVNPGGAAAGAGMEQLDWELVATNSVLLINNMDVIQAIDGNAVSNVQEFENEMMSKVPGQPITVDVQRITETFSGGSKSTNSQELQFTITTQELLPDITSSGQQLLEDIWHERRIELALEQHRLFDTRRQGRTGDLLRAQGKDFDDNTHMLFPIPQGEVDLNPEMEQNPGYN